MLVLVRHGQSEWNLQNRFTGWVDVDLTDKGKEEAMRAGKILKNKGYEFDVVFTSVLRRAIKTTWLIQTELQQEWVPTTKAWQLNERHYGALQGLNKKETAEKYGDEKVHQWRRSYATLPPLLENDELGKDRRYKGIQLPKGEALKETVERVIPYWEKNIEPQIAAGKNVLIVAHGNSLRALVKHLSGMSDEEIISFEFETAVPLVCELNNQRKMTKKEFLKD
ncbi:MAG: 2,3-diphosphoglycerate-dependent phosphoglycerate mutase [Bdellovibrionales bacterium]|nr:2,3-diphosphoglycerate-dependent phosphoglycerate mutase [Bdellovibrionales bacterium]